MRTKNKMPYKTSIGEPECNKGDEAAITAIKMLGF